jgi:hypothetical protein
MTFNEAAQVLLEHRNEIITHDSETLNNARQVIRKEHPEAEWRQTPNGWILIHDKH